MTTVVDPAGTPVAIYNRSGTTIVELWPSVGLPPAADIGDIVEVYWVDVATGQGLNAFAPSGEAIVRNPSEFYRATFRKVTPTTWVVMWVL
jgi:hypothetical protein